MVVSLLGGGDLRQGPGTCGRDHSQSSGDWAYHAILPVDPQRVKYTHCTGAWSATEQKPVVLPYHWHENVLCREERGPPAHRQISPG